MKPIQLLSLCICLITILACKQQKPQLFTPDQPNIRYIGRIDLSNPQEPILVGSASFIEVPFSGDSCNVLLKKEDPTGEHNYVAMELDGEYLGRIRIDNDSLMPYKVEVQGNTGQHVLKIFKVTEAQNGNIAFGGVKCMALDSLSSNPKKKIEFIGNSITCGMGVDHETIPCDSGVWYDQHNAYWAYGPRVARDLDAQFMLSSVSGIGMYRNWNSLEPVMPDVYENMYLNTDDSKKWDFDRFTPDLVSICLGTNDMSEGDGEKERLPFDSAQFVSHYIDFVNTIFSKYPDPQICLLTSPMVSGEKGELLASCIKAIQQHFREAKPNKKEIAIYNFTTVTPHGCDYHPDKGDHEKMAKVLVPFYRDVMGW